MRGTGSIENLYPPSYGSRGSSSLSLSSSGGYQRSFSVNAPGINRESVKMYSSLPMVFSPTTLHDTSSIRQCAHNHSDDRLALTCSHQDKHGRQFPMEAKFGNGSHFYTPLRGRRLTERKIKGSNQRKQMQLHVSMFRSSSDGQRKSQPVFDSDPLMNTPTLLIDDMPPLPPKSADVIALETKPQSSDTVSSEESSVKHQNMPQQDSIVAASFDCSVAVSSEEKSSVKHEYDGSVPPQDISSVLNASFDYSAADTSLMSESIDSHSNDFKFPSPPPPSSQIADDAEDCKLSDERQSEGSILATESSTNAQIFLPENGNIMSTKEDILPDYSMDKNLELSDSVNSTLKCEVLQEKDDIINLTSNAVTHSKASMKKLSSVFGPEFIAMNGLQQERKVRNISNRDSVHHFFMP